MNTAELTRVQLNLALARISELEAALRKVKSGLPWTDKGDALFALCEAALSTAAETEAES